MYIGDKEGGRDLSLRFVKDYFDSKGINLPAVSSIQRHYNNHLVYYIEHQDDIPKDLIIDYKKHRGNSVKLEAIQDEIKMRMDAIAEGTAKKVDVFPPTHYNSTTGEGGDKLTWKQWCFRFIKIMDDETGDIVPMVIPKHVEDLFDIMDRRDGLLILIARGHFKSTILEVYVLRKLLDFKMRVLYIGKTNEEVLRYTENIRDKIENNQLILYYYGFILKKSSKKGIYLDNNDFSHDANLSTSTLPSNSSGVSKLGGHADLIVGDDLQGEDIKDNDKLQFKHQNWMDKNVIPMRKGKTKLIFAGTRKDANDIYAYIKKKKMLITIESPGIIKFPNGKEDEYKLIKDENIDSEYYEGGQQEPEIDPSLFEGRWHYHTSVVQEEVNGRVTDHELIDGVEGIEGGEVFFDGFRESKWKNRFVQYYNKDGSIDRNRMAMQELLIEKYILEADETKGHFAFWSEYQLRPVETKGKYFNADLVNFYTFDIWKKIVENDAIAKFTWIDVGYSLPKNITNSSNGKPIKKGKTVMCTASLIIPGRPGYEEFRKEDGGMYVLEVRTGDYFLKHEDPSKSLVHQLLRVESVFNPVTICFEDNYFGQYIRGNSEANEELTHLPIEGRSNKLDKGVRISTGVNSRLCKTNNGLFLCKDAVGFTQLYKQIVEFPYVSKNDEIDAMESCDRLLLRTAGKVSLIGDLNAISHKTTGISHTDMSKLNGSEHKPNEKSEDYLTDSRSNKINIYDKRRSIGLRY